MRRADRLFELIQLLRGGRLRTAYWLGEALGVSPRTIYRDIADLQAQGVPIDGERGVGYLLREGYFLPPLSLTPAEMEALELGVRFVRANADEDLAGAAEELLVKIGVVTHAEARGAPSTLRVFAPEGSRAARDVLAQLRVGLADREVLALTYRDGTGQLTLRRVRPLGVEYWGHVWTLTAWCEMREDFRVFRCDRIEAVAGTGERFRDQPGRTMADFIAQLSREPKAVADVPLQQLKTDEDTMHKDEIKGAANKAKGAVKDAVGKATDNPKLRAEGKADKAKGTVQENVGKAKEAVRDALKN